jgi:hypothetical protein
MQKSDDGAILLQSVTVVTERRRLEKHSYLLGALQTSSEKWTTPFFDSSPKEKHDVTLATSVYSFSYKGNELTLIDTPGGPD